MRLDRDLETAAAHAQFGDQRGGRRRQRVGGLAARLRRARRRPCASATRAAVDFGIERVQRVRRRRAGVRVRRRSHRAARASCSGGDAVLAGEVVQARRAGVRAASKAAGSRSRSLRTRSSRASASSSWIAAVSSMASTSARRGSCSACARSSLRTCCRLPRQRRAFVAAEARERAVAGGDQAGGMGMAAVAGDAARRSTRARASRARVRRAGARASRCVRTTSPCATASRVRAAARSSARAAARDRRPVRRRVRPIGVEQRQLAGARQQRLVLVLAVDLDQQAGQFGQLRQGRRPAVDPGARAAVGADHAAQLAGRRRRRRVRCSRSQARRGGRVVEGELGDQFGAFGAVADHAAVGAQARTGSPAHRPATTCRRRFRRRSRSGRGRSRVRRRGRPRNRLRRGG